MSEYIKPKNVKLYHPTHGKTISISDELKYRSCSQCNANDRYGNEFLAKKCPNLKKQYLRPGELDAPDELISKVIFQIDGVLSDTRKRDELKDKDIKTYYEACYEDDLIQPTLHLMHNLVEAKFYTVEIWSFRPEYVRDITELWLDKTGLSTKRFRLRLAPSDDIEETISYYSSLMEESMSLPVLAYLSHTRFANKMKDKGVAVLSL